MEILDILFCAGEHFRHVQHIGIDHTSSAGREYFCAARRVISYFSALHIKELDSLVPVPRHEKLSVVIQFSTRGNIRKFRCESRQIFLVAAGM